MSVKVYSSARGERGPSGTQVNLTLSLGASTDLADRPATASDGDTWGLLGGGMVTFFIWQDGAWVDAGGFTDAAILGAGARIYASTTDGLMNTDNGGLFLVAQGAGTSVWQNVGGQAVQRGWIGEALYDDFPQLIASTDTGLPEGTYIRTRREGLAFRVAPPGEANPHRVTGGGVKLYETGMTFSSLARFQAAVGRGETYIVGSVVVAEGSIYHYSGQSSLPGLPGWELMIAPGLEARIAALEGLVSPALIADAVAEYLADLTGVSGSLEDLVEAARISAALAESAKVRACACAEAAKVSAQASALSAAAAEAAKAGAEAARDGAIIGASGVYGSTAAGLAGTTDTEWFVVAADDGWRLYQNAAGELGADVYGPYPSLETLDARLVQNTRDETVEYGRPGELLSRYTVAVDGAPGAGADPDGAVVNGQVPYGKVLDVGPARIVATRERYWLDPDVDLVVRGVFRMQSNSCDPEGEKITLGVEYLNSAYVSVGQQLLFDQVVQESDGWQNIERIIRRGPPDLLARSGINVPFDPNALDPTWSAEDAILECSGGGGEEPAYPDPFFTAPVDASYAVPFIQTYGTDGVTRIAVLEIQKNANNITADRITYPLGFQFPQEVLPGERIKRTIFVAQHGDDAANGRSLREAVRNVERAVELALEDDCVKYSIQVWPGEYETAGNIDVPDNVSEITGMSGQRSARFIPASGAEGNNVFRLGDGGMLRNISGEGWQVDDFDDPTSGFLAVFRPGALIRRAVYIDHCVMYRGQVPEYIPSPLDPENGNPNVPRGPGICMADASVCDPNSPFPQMMIEASTTSAPNGVGYVVKGDAFINCINSISIWPHKHFLALDGGEMLLNNCACQFGDYTLWSEGSKPRLEIALSGGGFTVDAAARTTLNNNRTAIVNAMWAQVVADGFGSVDEDFSRRDADNLITSLGYDLLIGTQETTDFFLRGLFPAGVFVAAPGLIPAFVSGFQGMRAHINGLAMGAAAKAMVLGLMDLVISTVQSPLFGVQPSLISAAAHQFNMPFGGVNRRAFRRFKRAVPDTIVERDLGTVIYSGLDDLGKQYFTGGALVNPITGQFEGPPVDRTIYPRAVRAAIIAGGML